MCGVGVWVWVWVCGGCVGGWWVSGWVCRCGYGIDKYGVVILFLQAVGVVMHVISFVSYSTFDRLLDAKLREEELTIPVLRPSPDQYK